MIFVTNFQGGNNFVFVFGSFYSNIESSSGDCLDSLVCGVLNSEYFIFSLCTVSQGYFFSLFQEKFHPSHRFNSL